jgi:hypothetical protein
MEDRAVQGSKIELPSQGFLYGGKIPNGEVVVSPMTTREEKMLASAGTAGGQGVVDMLISRCVHSANGTPLDMKSDDFLVGDRLYLMMAIRAVTFGQKYEFQMRCECGQSFKHDVAVPDDLETIYLKEEVIEPVEVELPISKVKLGLRLLRGSDEKAITKFADQQYERVNVALDGDPSYTYRMIRHIVWMEMPASDQFPEGQRIENPDFATPIEGEEPMRPAMKRRVIDQMVRIYEQLLAQDTQAVRDALSENDCGMNTEITYDCPKCRNKYQTMLPMKVEFFRPGGDRGVRYL